jgi:hypothetical protein
MPGGFARIQSQDARARRNWNRFSQRFEDLVLSAPLGLDSDSRITILTGDGITVVSDQLVVNLGNGVEFSSSALVVTPGANVSVDGDGVNALPIPAWFFDGGHENTRRASRDGEARGRALSWFL